MNPLFASIPSPTVGRLSIGPLGVSAYGLMIALGVIAGTTLASRRLERSGAGTSEDMQSIALWSVVGGVIGARLYHVATAWELFADDYARIPMIWRGGLGIPGGLLGGTLAGIGLCLILLGIDRYRPMRPGRLFGVYVIGYFLGRFWIEGFASTPPTRSADFD